MIRLKRIHDAAAADDGRRVLVDRLWPRGVSKERAALDDWAKQVSPSNALRKEFHARGDRDSFEAAYRLELERVDLGQLAAAAQEGTLTLLTAVKNPEGSHAAVLKAVLEEE